MNPLGLVGVRFGSASLTLPSVTLASRPSTMRPGHRGARNGALGGDWVAGP